MPNHNRRKTDGNRVVCIVCNDISVKDVATHNIFKEHNYGFICDECRIRRLIDLRNRLENYDGK